MMRDILIIIDVQNDFVTGTLGTSEARKMLPKLINKARGFQGEIIMTQDTHGDDYFRTQEGHMLPVAHCVKGTDGWNLVDELEALKHERCIKVYEKPCFGSVALMDDIRNRDDVGSIEIVGLCTDICVVSNALMLKAALPEVRISVDASCCAGVTADKHNAALEIMRSCQIIVKE